MKATLADSVLELVVYRFTLLRGKFVAPVKTISFQKNLSNAHKNYKIWGTHDVTFFGWGGVGALLPKTSRNVAHRLSKNLNCNAVNASLRC